MKKPFVSYFLLISLLGLCACSQDNVIEEPALTPEQQELIGRAVNFAPSFAESFNTRVNYTTNNDGSFNEKDIMRVYRQYYDKENGQWSSNEAYRTYYRVEKTVADIITLGINWIIEKDRKGKNETGEEFTQQENDSLTWDNGETLRFRAWSRSNFYHTLTDNSKNNYYPDFSMANWVTASGPTMGIPMSFQHMTCRIMFASKLSGNEFSNIEISTDPVDYMYSDNADTNANDELDKVSSEQAEKNARLVETAYNKMCMPAGVDIERGLLYGMLKSYWNQTSPNLSHLEEHPEAFYSYGTKAPADVTKEVQRPLFRHGNDNSFYLFTIPYDMSNVVATQGENLWLPACTRFRVYVRDVNNGDQYGTSGYEGKYHIFALSDIKVNGEPKYPNGLEMKRGVSYRFTVGYHYDGLKVTVDEQLDWDNTLSLGDQSAQDACIDKPVSTPSDYVWWKTAITTAINNVISGHAEDFHPVFHITNAKEFLEFINLVNGDATTKTTGLYRRVKTFREEIIGGVNVQIPDEYGWSTTPEPEDPKWKSEAAAELEGYIFYDRYKVGDGTSSASSERAYINGPYPFYDQGLSRSFTVHLDSDLDLNDWQLESIGKSETCKFMGNFEGNMHKISNLNMREEYLFGYMDGAGKEKASIRNLQISSIHKTGLLRNGVNSIHLVGISLLANSTTNSIAGSLTDGTSYVVGCIHVGDASGALVGTASDLYMMGCMQAAEGISGGALLGGYAQGARSFFAPQLKFSEQKTAKNFSAKPEMRRFVCNYYDTTLSPSAKAVSTTSDDYSLLEYIRGAGSHVLRAKNDYLMDDVPMAALAERSDLKDLYGLAPWKAMNFAIQLYNDNWGLNQICQMHYESNSIGYNHRYPTLVALSPADAGLNTSAWNPLDQPN